MSDVPKELLSDLQDKLNNINWALVITVLGIIGIIPFIVWLWWKHRKEKET